MKIIEYNTVPVEKEKEVSFDMEHLKDLFEDLTQNFDKVDFTDKDVLDEINAGWILSKDEMKQLPKLYAEWYSKNEYYQCKEEVNKILDILCTKYSDENIQTCVDQYFW